MSKKHDEINSPSHYQSETGLEVIEVIEAFKLNFNLGNCIKYILRAGKKEHSFVVLDLEKAEYYLKREIAKLKKS